MKLINIKMLANGETHYAFELSNEELFIAQNKAENLVQDIKQEIRERRVSKKVSAA